MKANRSSRESFRNTGESDTWNYRDKALPGDWPYRVAYTEKKLQQPYQR